MHFDGVDKVEPIVRDESGNYRFNNFIIKSMLLETTSFILVVPLADMKS